ncbi:HAMP domain-containing protein [Chloroflexales bacterium ZM16-3]|nr:HAMP domain-containing protein [Chloroflexales bacterium ZM16-3]
MPVTRRIGSGNMSFRARLTLAYTGFFTLALFLLGCGIYFSVRQSLYGGVERDLWAATQQVRAIFNAGGLEPIRTPSGEISLFLKGEFIQIFNNPNLGAQVFGPTGDLLDSTPNLGGHGLTLPEGSLALGADDINSGLTSLREINDVRIQSLVTPLVLKSGKVVGILQISRPLKDVDLTLGMLTVILLGGGAIALMMTAGGAALLSRRALLPIDLVTQTAQGIVRAEDLGQRVPVPPQQDELHRLTVTINELLGRLEGLFNTQQRFVADVSHELRTPLAAMQGNLEILARGACANPEILEETIGDMRRETARLIRMVNDLLVIAQSDTRRQIRSEPVELDTLMLEVYRELRALAGAVTLRIGAEDQVLVAGDRDRLKQALLNLGVNAIQHTAAGGYVTLGLEQRNGFACLTVADTGEGISEEDLPHIFDRFFRADRSRSRHNGGAGLGLSIVRWVAEAHRGTVTVASIPGRGSTFAIWLPLPDEVKEMPLDNAPAELLEPA